MSGRTKQEHYDFLRELSVQGLKSAAIGALAMARDGVTVTEVQYREAVQYTADGMGLSLEDAAKVLTWPKFLRQTAGNYHFEEIIQYVKNYLKQEVQS